MVSEVKAAVVFIILVRNVFTRTTKVQVMRQLLQNVLRRLGFVKKYKTVGILISSGNDKTRQVMARMNQLMEEHRPFLRARYSIRNLAEELNIPSHHLSALLNKHMGVSFNDYLNNHRIRHCQELIRHGAAGNLNLKGLSAECGFNNRNSFTTAFKKFTGHNPSVFAKKHKILQKI
jgi:YesN/AraC family two-component response regulator